MRIDLPANLRGLSHILTVPPELRGKAAPLVVEGRQLPVAGLGIDAVMAEDPDSGYPQPVAAGRGRTLHVQQANTLNSLQFAFVVTQLASGAFDLSAQGGMIQVAQTDTIVSRFVFSAPPNDAAAASDPQVYVVYSLGRPPAVTLDGVSTRQFPLGDLTLPAGSQPVVVDVPARRYKIFAALYKVDNSISLAGRSYFCSVLTMNPTVGD